MGLFRKRKSRATRRAEARALKAGAKLEARLAAKGEAKRFRASQRADARALKAQIKSDRNRDRTARKAAESQLKAARDGRILSPARVRRTLVVTRMLAPVVVPLVYRAAMAVRGLIDEQRAARLGVPLARVGEFSGNGARLSARIAGAEKTLRLVQERKPKDSETKQFVAAITDRLSDLSTAVTAIETMPGDRRRVASASISDQLDGIDADLMARLGLPS
ncbi:MULTISPECIES: DUF6474 family protein [Mycolicibacter]|uniref:Uncharacterized protein n=1 Tax=Mycolicibacter virginiensis TaxID=1795032 RepID=A0A9X7IMC7_9MYCO|nr:MULTISPECIES: DUF6474 family protein [Mycobacteriaceae]OBG37341.1 hypothetical protein A5671_19895 [Mycolicibacter heraklionensis]OBJ31638.1 hypothetical protein A5631_11005 [Mycolicibacter heraklionensis]PQM51874.1 hypothetical protein C5U48_12420 [Mycolicibacter virginiensis]ULP47480.1 DUF6474 family protein [Mycolicibacter virginiensis]